MGQFHLRFLIEMAPKKELTIDQRISIVALKNAGLSIRAIAAQVKCSKNGVSCTLKRYAETNSTKNRNGRSGVSKLSARDKRAIKINALKNIRIVLREHAEVVNQCQKFTVCKNTVNKALHEFGLFGRIAQKKPLLRKKNIRDRLKWAREHRDWTNEQWANVLWTDESQFMLFGSNKRFYIRRRVGEKYLNECLHPTMKHGKGSVMVWGGFCANGTSPLKLITGKMDKIAYRQILIHYGLKSGT